MLIGQSVFVPAAGSPGVVYHGPWMPRQGNNFTGVFQVLKSSSAGWTLKCEVFTKNNEDADSAATTLGSTSLTTDTTQNASFSNCKELVRYVFSCSGGGTDRWIHFRSNPPIWQPN